MEFAGPQKEALKHWGLESQRIEPCTYLRRPGPTSELASPGAQAEAGPVPSLQPWQLGGKGGNGYDMSSGFSPALHHLGRGKSR